MVFGGQVEAFSSTWGHFKVEIPYKMLLDLDTAHEELRSRQRSPPLGTPKHWSFAIQSAFHFLASFSRLVCMLFDTVESLTAAKEMLGSAKPKRSHQSKLRRTETVVPISLPDTYQMIGP